MKKLITQAIRFFGLSGIGWLLDFSVFAMLGRVSDNLVVNNVISSWVGVSFVFLTATRKVFQSRSRISLKWKYLIYLLYQCILIFLISEVLGIINTGISNNISFKPVQCYSGLVSKILVTPVTMVLNFLVMKGIVEKL